MPATAGRVRMPANNRVHSSAALQTHGIWQSAIGYDPYAPNKDEPKASSSHHNDDNAPEPGGENAYMSFQGLLELAKITNTNDNESRGCCKKCGRVGHLTFQCKNFISVKEEIKDKGLDSVLGGGVVRLEKSCKVRGGKGVEESSDEESSESSDSGYDLEIERAIAKRCGKSASSKVMDGRKKDRESGGEDSGSAGGRKKRKRSESRTKRKAKDSDSESEVEDGRRKRRKVKYRKRDKSVDDEESRHRRRKRMKEKRRTSCRHSKEKKSYKRSDKKRYKHNQDDLV